MDLVSVNMGRKAKPYYWNCRQGWYATVNGKSHVKLINGPNDKETELKAICIHQTIHKFNTTNQTEEYITDKEFEKIKRNALKRKINFNLSKYDINLIYSRQHKKCALTKQNIVFNTRTKYGNASIDRIDSDKDYIINNIQILHKDVNLAKRTLSQDEFINMCKLVAENN